MKEAIQDNSSEVDSEKTLVSRRFSATDHDVTLCSCDGILFQVHRKNLEVHSEAFAGGQAFSTQGEIVHLTERSSILELLLQYIYPQPPPNLELLAITLLVGLAEAAEKYLFHAVIHACKLRMKQMITKHPFHILKYAARHNHSEIMDPAAEAVLLVDTSKFERQPCEIPGWFHYSNSWNRAMANIYNAKVPLVRAHKLNLKQTVACDKWRTVYGVVASRLGGKPGALLDVDSLFSGLHEMVKNCFTCGAELQDWQNKARLAKASIKPLSSYVV